MPPAKKIKTAKATVHKTKPASKPPATYTAFMAKYPDLAKAWDSMTEAGRVGPLGENEIRLIKLAISMGAMRQGAVHSGVRKALDKGISPAAIEQVCALAASTIGMPATVAVYSWMQDELQKQGR